MRIFDHHVSLKFFEHLLTSGDLVKRAATYRGNSAAVVQLIVNSPHSAKRAQVDTLHVGEQLHRTWHCEQPGHYAAVGLDVWQHDEYCTKTSEDRLTITDRITFHNGASVAQRTYVAVAVGASMMACHVEPWKVAMQGLNAFVRGRVEKEMCERLPVNDEKMDMIIKEAAHDADAAA